MLQANLREDIQFGEETFGLMEPDIVRLFTTFNKVGFWRIDIDTGHGFCDAQAAEIFGMDAKDGPLDMVVLSSRIHPEDLAAVMESHEMAAVEHCSFQKIHRVLLDDGRYKYICCLGAWRARPDSAGEIVGVMFDLPKHQCDLRIFPQA
ncbi:PAS domain-containing protein [Rhizobium sp. CSW-27]|uniref:PAS domain-containing protein n=1 Tax=Rhizobium sp. CSW-27 TaxID=2839985 RepID=UPI001C032F3E|nr:PAS domain-containing protein [Rhizobium sp. CSW-27]MBT9369581.1 PAS domain-containing protein [Rhizobium sp. CSW-27]